MTAPLTIGSLFSGYGGLDRGVAAAIDEPTRLAWVCEIEPAPARILAHHHPDVPNLGDITQVQWAPTCPQCDTVHTVRVWRLPDDDVYRCRTCGWELPVSARPAWVPYPTRVLTGGFPCQDLSLAGGRAGLREGTRSGLWSHMATAIDHMRPDLVVIENVRGILSATAHSDVEPCPWCVGDDPGEPPLRALGAVLADLADLGYDAAWHGLRAADVGAPHGRYRVFIAAWPADTDGERLAGTEHHSGGRPAATDDPLGRGVRAPADPDDGGREGRPRQLRSGGRGEPADRRGTSPDPHRNGQPRRTQGAPGAPDQHGPGPRTPAAGRRGLPPADPARGAAPRGSRRAPADPDSVELRDEPVGEPGSGRPAIPGHPRLIGRAVPDTDGIGRDEGRPEPAGQLGGPHAPLGSAGPTRDTDGRRAHGDTPCGREPREQNGSPRRDEPIVTGAGAVPRDRAGDPPAGVHDLGRTAPVVAWGPYAAAVHRWERILDRVRGEAA